MYAARVQQDFPCGTTIAQSINNRKEQAQDDPFIQSIVPYIKGKEIPAAYYMQTGSSSLFVSLSYPQPTIKVNLIKDDVALIRKVFHLSVTDFASIMVVSRQSVYDWNKTDQISEDHSKKLSTFAMIARKFEANRIEATPYLLRRKVTNNLSLIDLLNSSMDIEKHVNHYIEQLSKELRQREMINAQMKSRKRSLANPAHYGKPHLDEKD